MVRSLSPPLQGEGLGVGSVTKLYFSDFFVIILVSRVFKMYIPGL